MEIKQVQQVEVMTDMFMFNENLSHRTQVQPFFEMDKLKKFVH